MEFKTIIVLWLVGSVLARHTKPVSFISNGEDFSNVPCYAYLEIFKQANFSGPIMYFGGGTLLNSFHVLTVAQNVDRYKSWRIGMGSNRISEMDWFYSIKAIIHPDYDSTDLSNNLALVRLNAAAINRGRIQPVFLLPLGLNFPPEGKTNEMTGFGFGSVNEQPTTLQRTLFTVISEQECSDAYPHLVDNGQLVYHFCALGTESRTNICAGDQGGPFYDPVLNLLLGIASFNRFTDCHQPNAQPSAFIRITPYISWINPFLLPN